MYLFFFKGTKETTYTNKSHDGSARTCMKWDMREMESSAHGAPRANGSMGYGDEVLISE